MDKMVGIKMPSSMRTMVWLHRRTHDGSRVYLIP